VIRSLGDAYLTMSFPPYLQFVLCMYVVDILGRKGLHVKF